ncbi:uncharacterized protein LOC113279390 [Papaver somniferum]|uniref:uncharacterized protein LOC113279390 n=1 Tax=Papaver somniferum TaxID=3469 RepID=UPI000E700102|nr:uncharacterized protein LOC113279390 [Papaver somniferum]
MIFVDATFLTGKFKGCLMSATGKNANQDALRNFSFGYGIVFGKNVDNWRWFLNKLKDILRTSLPLTFISDHHDGLVYAIKGFRDGMAKLKEMGCDGLHEFLSDLPVECWSTTHCKGCRFGDMCSNIAESFNNWVTYAKIFPVAALVNEICIKIMDQMNKRRLKGASYSRFVCRRIEKRIKKSIHDGGSLRITKCGDLIFEVQGDHSFVVDLNKWYCSCYKWFTYQFPCDHAIQCMVSSKLSVYEFLNPFFSISFFRASYSQSINPVPINKAKKGCRGRDVASTLCD